MKGGKFKLFTNREIAVGIWLIIIIIYAFTKENVRKAFANIIKVAVSKKLFILYVIIYSYLGTMIFILYKIGFWNVNLIKDTCIWLIAIPVPALIKVNEMKEKYFRMVLKDYISFSIIIEYIMGNYTFSILLEFILQPLILLFSLLVEIGEKFGATKETKKVARYIVFLIIIFFIFNSVKLAVQDYNNLLTFDSLREVILTPVLTIVYLPVLYLILVYMSYEMLFLRLNMKKYIDKKERRKVKIKVIKKCGLSSKKIRDFDINEELNLYFYNNRD